MNGLLLGCVELAVDHTRTGAHALHLTGFDDGAVVSHVVLVFLGALEDVGNDFHVLMRVRGEASSRRYGVVVDHAERAETHVLLVVVASEGKRVMRVEPSVVRVTTVFSFSNREHRFVPPKSFVRLQ